MSSKLPTKKLDHKNDTEKVKKSNVNRSEMIWYFVGVFVRIIWTLIYFQKGYIHPVRKKLFNEKKKKSSSFF